MGFTKAVRASSAVLALCATLAFSGSGSHEAAVSGEFCAPEQRVGDGTAKTCATVDESGNPTAVALRISEHALDGLPQTQQHFMLDLPSAASSTVFEHVMLDWNPQGHTPEALYGKPHFDMHFYEVSMAEVDQIDLFTPDFIPHASNLPEPRYVPQDYVPPPGLPILNTTTRMGLHWTDATEPLIPGQYNFEQILMQGSWNGKFIFIEPMITRAWLQTRPTLEQDIKQPAAYQHSGYYPTTYTVGFDDATYEYVVSLGAMTMRTAS